MVTNRLSCLECKQCNRKGKPSVLRFSKYCDESYTKKLPSKLSFFTNIKNKFFDKRFNEETGKLDKRGFRDSWFR